MPSKTKEINNTEKKVSNLKQETKKTNKKTAVAKKTTTKTKKVATPKTKITDSKKSTKKTTAKSVTATTTKKKSAKTNSKVVKKISEIVEYYDLPYRYNETIVKILYQTPDTLFVYWDISDNDRENYIKEYGENFFNITRPVLIVHNKTMNYSFEIPINDFANSWYFHINDSKCDYAVELGRRPNYYNEQATKEIEEHIHTDYIYVSTSNKIESPNDHILFSTNNNNTVKFRNIKNNNEESISLYEIVKNLPKVKKTSNIPYISKDIFQILYSGIYQNEDISLFERISNPTSGGNPSSGSLSSRFN